MKKLPTLAILTGLCLVFITCRKPEPADPNDPPVKTFEFPLSLKPYKVEIVDPVKVYIKTGYQTKQEIQSFDPEIVQHEVFNKLGENVITALKFESEGWANYDPPTINDRMQVTKNGNAFTFSVTVGANTSCKAIGSGDYDDLYLECQAFNRHSSNPVLAVSYDGFRDPCYPNTALDCNLGDTIAILNYRIHLKKL
jgi:hypothetical protein